MELTVNDFFCGAGGVGIGFQQAGFKVIWACDFDKYAVQTYRHNVGDHVIQADIKKLTRKDIPIADVWAFGFPCQDLSIAGKQKGFRFICKSCSAEWNYRNTKNTQCPVCGSTEYQAASRSGMFFEMMRLLDEFKTESPQELPKVLFIENVKGLKPYLGLLKKELAIRGFTAYIQLYNSKWWGVPQNRERYYIVATGKGIHGFEFPEEQHEYIPKLSTALDEKVDDKYFIPDEKAKSIINQAKEKLGTLGKVHACITPDRVNKRQNGRRAKSEEEEMFTLTAQDIHGVILECEGSDNE